ncbi:hypothetical protein QFC22_002976 [Naganishia vaughanmartiniae]|uniref:Uncharacterized protein n=1 Tax=Naganishia vaughanmartiniae TaxID=1424756 RepID=A0ACC2X8Y3_9TREE|nr:hypothetical protein QFC22_002976 [Naganishia vaughanmartiniae]
MKIISLLTACFVAVAASVAAQEGGLIVDTLYKPEECLLKSQKGDKLSMQGLSSRSRRMAAESIAFGFARDRRRAGREFVEQSQCLAPQATSPKDSLPEAAVRRLKVLLLASLETAAVRSRICRAEPVSCAAGYESEEVSRDHRRVAERRCLDQARERLR